LIHNKNNDTFPIKKYAEVIPLLRPYAA